MMGKNLKFILNLALIATSLFLASCRESSDPKCYDPDDFGFPKITVAANGSNVGTFGINQISMWTDSKYKINGDILALKVQNYDPVNKADGRWYPWFSRGGVYWGDTLFGSTPACTFNPDMRGLPGADTAINNPPCYLDKGIGLYGLITDPARDETPNDSYNISQNPSAINAATFHMGESTSVTDYRTRDTDATYSSYQAAQIHYGGYIGEPPTGAKLNGNLYFKILDRYYSDNGGSYVVVMKHGISKTEAGAIETVLVYVDTIIMTATQLIYQRLVVETNFADYVRAMLVLYVIAISLLYLLGLTEMKQDQLFLFMFKFGIILTLISHQSWTFFHDYFFTAFVDGITEITGYFLGEIVVGAKGGWGFFDSLLGVLFSSETSYKIVSLFFTKSMMAAIIYIPILYIIIIMFALAIIKTAIEWIFSVMAIGLMIILFPIFAPFMLFRKTQDLFNQWMKQMISYFIQAVLALITLGFFAELIMHQFYITLGYGVCWKDVFTLFDLSIGGWKPAGMHLDTTGNALMGMTWIPEAYVDQGNIVHMPYSGQEMRYVDFPFLIPGAEDYRVRSALNGYYILFEDIFIFFLLAFLFLKFMDILTVAAQGISGNPIQRADFAAAAGQFTASVGKTFSKAMDLTPATKNIKERLGAVTDKYSIDALAKKGEKAMDKLENKALRKLAPKPIADFMERSERGFAKRQQSILGLAGNFIGNKIDLREQESKGGGIGSHFLNNLTNGALGKRMGEEGPMAQVIQSNETIKGIADFGKKPWQKAAIAGALLVPPVAAVGGLGYGAYKGGQWIKDKVTGRKSTIDNKQDLD